MSKQKNKNTFRIGALLLVACLISSVMLSGTFAKYTSEYAGQDTALVARWSFGAEGGQSGSLAALTDSTAELDLFQHAYDTYINQTGSDGEDTRYIIAPGVGGNFVIDMNYLADVDADVEIALETLSGNAAVPIEYSVDGGITWVTLSNLAEALANKIIADEASATESSPAANGFFRITKVAHNSVAPVEISETVQWKWRYTKGEAGSAYGAQTDADDTTLGEASQTAAVANSNLRTKYGIKVTLTATQVTPATGDETSITAIATITGTTEVDEVLNAGAFTPGAATASYQWQRSDSANGAFSDIAAATANTYTLVAGDEDKYIRVVATGTGDYTNTVRSAAVGPITNP